MARSDLLISLVRAGATGNQALFRRATEALIAEERSKNHALLADRLSEELDRQASPTRNGTNSLVGTTTAPDLLFELVPRRRLDDLVLAPDVRDVARQLIEEHHRTDLLRAHNLEPRHRVLLTGPPGNGKTSLAEAIASELMVPLLIVRYESLIASYLGETASRLRKLFDHIRTRPAVLFFDEFDTIGKERGDTHETGEIKRVVSSLLLQIDTLPPYVSIITATNHPELLDRAVWRRFQVRLELKPPNNAQSTQFIEVLAERMGLRLPETPRQITQKLKPNSFSDIEEFMTDVARRCVLSSPDSNLKAIFSEQLRQSRAKSRPSE